MTTTTYKMNYDASVTDVFRQSLVVALCEIASAVQGEDPDNISIPAGYNKGSTNDIKKQNLHEERVALAYKILENPLGWANQLAISVAENMDVYTASGVIFMASDDEGATNTDYSNAVSALWSAWAVTSNDIIEGTV